MANKFFTVPEADTDANDLPTTLANAILHPTAELAGMANGTGRIAFVIRNPSAVFTPIAPAVPAAFTAGQWSLADSQTGGSLTLTITALPEANPSIITIQRRIDIGAVEGDWVSLGSATTGTYYLTELDNGTAYTVYLRAVNSVGPALASDAKSATPGNAAATAPAVVTDWGATDAGTGGAVLVTINTPPNDGGSEITGYDYRVDGGAAVAMDSGTATVSGLTDTTEYDFQVRARNAVGAGDWSSAIPATPTTSDAPVLSLFVFEPASFSFTSTDGGDWYWMTSEFVTRTTQQIIDATGAYDSGTINIAAGVTSGTLNYPNTPTNVTVYFHAVLVATGKPPSNQLTADFQIADNYAAMEADTAKKLWLRPSGVVTETVEEVTTVTTWNDSGPSEFVFTAPTTVKPIPNDGGVRFNAAAGMRSGSATGIFRQAVVTAEEDITVFIVGRSHSDGVKVMFGENADTNSTNAWRFMVDNRLGNNTSRFQLFSNGTNGHNTSTPLDTPNAVMTSKFIAQGTFNAATRGAIDINGGFRTSANSNTTFTVPGTSWKLSIGGLIADGGGTNQADGAMTIYEVYATTATGATLTDIRANLAAAYDVTLGA